MRSTHVPPQVCRDPLTARAVIMAPQRAERPNELAGTTIECPFCAGNESLTPPDVLRTPADCSAPWRARIVTNQFPVACDRPAADDSLPGPIARGVHDVVIESPAHVSSILDVDPVGWLDAWTLCHRRLETLSRRADLAWATVFKNSGAAAGASLEHVHSQLVALDFIPQGLAAEAETVGRAVDPFGDILRAAEREDRHVIQSGDLVALVPPAPRQPFETWILPRAAERYFHATSADNVAALALLTREIIARLCRLVPAASYNWWLHQLPFTADRAGSGSWHWHLEIVPRINGLAGFELGTGCHINTMPPREAARQLRDA